MPAPDASHDLAVLAGVLVGRQRRRVEGTQEEVVDKHLHGTKTKLLLYLNNAGHPMVGVAVDRAEKRIGPLLRRNEVQVE